VLVMYRVVRRWAGPPAGLLAAGIFAATPIAASMFGPGGPIRCARGW
jgi:4-amino-4-deoxy-L-arabinose transferase-like glycosyltransferase